MFNRARTKSCDRGGNLASIQIFLIASTCFLYLVAAGLFSKAVWLFENYQVSKCQRLRIVSH